MDRSRKQLVEFFKILTTKLQSRQASTVLRASLTRDCVKLIGELAANFLAGNIGVNVKRQLRRWKSLIRKLGSKKTSHADRSALITKNTTQVLNVIKILLKAL
jgi:hypothetical protein